MKIASTGLNVGELPFLLRGDEHALHRCVTNPATTQVFIYFAAIIAGSGLYGAAMGLWRDPLQACFTAIKFPLVMVLTALGNALLNGMLAPLLGLNIGFRQSLIAVLMSFAIAALILGAFSPLLIFLIWNTPPIELTRSSLTSHSFVLLSEVVMIAFAGIAANLRLVQLLKRLSGSSKIAGRIVLSWLAGNLFLGSQLSWILRPFIGSPNLPVEFLRDDAFNGSFFESVFHAVRNLIFP